MNLLTHAEARQVQAVIRRLTREPITGVEAAVLFRLYPGKRATWCHAAERRFLRSINHVADDDAAIELTLAQRRFLWRIAFRHRNRLDGSLREQAWQNRAFAFAAPTGANAVR